MPLLTRSRPSPSVEAVTRRRSNRCSPAETNAYMRSPSVNSAFGDGHSRHTLVEHERRRDEHFGLQQDSRVRNQQAHLERAGVRIYLVVDAIDARGEAVVRVGGGSDL